MVLLHVKGVQKHHEFLHECSSKDSVDDISTNAVTIHNLRVTLKVVCDEMKETIKYGPMRTAQLKGLSADIIKETIPDLKMDDEDAGNCDFDLDPTARRIGIPIKNENIVKTLNELIQKVEHYMKPERVSLRHKGVTLLSELEDLMNECRGGLLIAYPMALPQYDLLQQLLIESTPLHEADINYSREVYDAKTAQLWFAAKKLLRTDELNKYIGNNEKTKIVVKISKQKGHMPVREPAVNEETRKKMMAYWHQKQEQNKELKEDDDNSYLESKWADTQSLKKQFLGMDTRLQYK